MIVLICTALAVTTFADPESSESAKTTAGVIAVPIAAMFAWTAVEAFRSRANILHKLVLPVLVIVGCVVFRNILDEQDRADRQKREQVHTEAHDAEADRVREKAAWMRTHATWATGSDEELAQKYDRLANTSGYVGPIPER